MPAFQDLPSELLDCIARHVGGDYFRNHPNSTLLCRNWRHSAIVIQLEEPLYTVKCIKRALRASERTKTINRSVTRQLTLVLTEPVESYQCNPRPRKYYNSWEEARDELCLRMKEILICFASELKLYSQMHTFRLELFLYLLQSNYRDKLLSDSVTTILSSLPEKLTSLTFDYGDKWISLVSGQRVEAGCPCSLLKGQPFIPHLRRLRIRSRLICKKIFDHLCHCKDLSLESIILNLGMQEQNWERLSTRVGTFDHSFWGDNSDCTDLHIGLSQIARFSLSKMERLHTLKVVRQIPHTEVVVAYDVITDQTVRLPKGIEWEDDCAYPVPIDPEANKRKAREAGNDTLSLLADINDWYEDL